MRHKNRMTILSLLLLGVMLASCVAPVTAPSPTSTPPAVMPLPPTVAAEPATALPVEPAATATAVVGELKLEMGKIISQALAGNLLGDPPTRTYYVLLPPSYTTSNRRYPVVYVLHGYRGEAATHVEDMRRSYELALAEGDVQEMIFVFPDANNKLGGSEYLSSPTIGDYETYLTQELVELVDATYRTIPSRNSRGVTGCSMGGSGAMYLALKYPDLFAVAAPAAGVYDWTRDPNWERGLGYYQETPDDFADFESVSGAARELFAMAAGAAPNPEKPPFYLDMPLAIVDGKAQIVPEVRDRIVAADPVHELERYLAKQERLNAIMIFHGDSDNVVPVDLARDFDKLLTDRAVEHEYLEVQGGHCEFGRQGYAPVLKFMSDNLAGEPAE